MNEQDRKLQAVQVELAELKIAHRDSFELWRQDREIIEDLKRQAMYDKDRLLKIKGLLIERTDQLLEAQERLLHPVVKVDPLLEVALRSNAARQWTGVEQNISSMLNDMMPLVKKYEEIVEAFRVHETEEYLSDMNKTPLTVAMIFLKTIRTIIGDDVNEEPAPIDLGKEFAPGDRHRSPGEYVGTGMPGVFGKPGKPGEVSECT